MGKTFRDALIDALERTRTSVADLSRDTGVSKDQLHKIKQGKSKSTNVDDAVKIASYFGVTLDQFLDDPTVRKDVEIIDLLRQLEPAERQFLLNAAKAQIAARYQARQEPPEGNE